jgi:hypothetical protein
MSHKGRHPTEQLGFLAEFLYTYIIKKRSSQAAMGRGEARPVPPFLVNEPKKTGAQRGKNPLDI